MRSNTPVTQRRVHIPQDATLMSTTDPDSRVTYANEAFLAVSGFCREELVGEPHNLVRHPDMPEAAFADMWATLRAGLSWSALVKNRSKSGDHYWVRANATPVRRDGRLVGYLSVRTCPGDEEVTQAEAAYQALRGGEAPGMAFHRGLLVHTGWRRWRSWPQTWSTGRRLGLAGLLAVAPAAVLAAVLLGGAEALAVLLALGLGWGASSWFLQRQIGGPVRRLRDHALAVAAGSAAECAIPTRSDDLGMLGRAIQQSGLNLRALLDDVGQQTHGIHDASAEIASSNDDLRQRTEGALACLSETSGALGTLGGTVRRNAEAAHQASELADAASAVAEQGGDSVGQAVSTMGDIAEQSRRIADIVGVIDGIAFQTNILALNAAVEAARAGELGRGFAVVAGEVRSLAQRSAGAAREIRDLIQSSVVRIDAGAQMAREAGATMAELVQQVRQVRVLVGDISQASAEQVQGIDVVSDAAGRLDRMVVQNAAMVQQSAAATRQLHERVLRLEEAMGAYRGVRAGM